MDYKEFEKMVITGHNMEFEYDNNKYSIVHGPDGFNFSELNSEEKPQVYTNAMQLLIKVKLDGKFLNDISNSMTNVQVY